MSDNHNSGGAPHDDQQQQQQRHWGKRLRDDSDEVRFSELAPDQKMQRRRQERQEKKERDRTLAYFRSVQRTMDEHARSGDSTVLANIVDGFFGELLKLLKADPTFHLLRNGVVCRAIEAALGSAVLLQSKTLLYVFLGHVVDLVTSPVASYTFETLMVSLSLGLSVLPEANPQGFEAEMTEGGPGMHTGSGVASAATLLRSMAEELMERAEDLLVHEVGSRAMRSIVLVLGGLTIRNAPPSACPVRHPALLGTLAEAVVAALEEGYSRECQTALPAESWLAAAQAPTTSFVVQSLLRVSEAGSPAHGAVVGRLEALSFKNKPLLWHLMTDHHLGSHLFQAYLRVPAPAAVVEAGDRETLRLERRLREEAQRQQQQQSSSACEEGGQPRQKKRASATDKLRELAADKGKQADAGAGEDAEALLACCWGKGLRMVQTAFSVLLSGPQLPFILQDLALGAPTAAHLYLLWEELLGKHLVALVGGSSAGVAALAVLARKCAFASSVRATSSGEDEDAGVPADINTVLRADEGQGVRYFTVPATVQQAICDRLCATLAQCDESAAPGEAAHMLLEPGAYGDKGLDLARLLFHLHPTASLALQRSVGQLGAQSLLAVAGSHKGSLVIQQFLRAASYWAATGRQPDGGFGPGTESEMAMRVLTKVEDRMHELVNSKYGAFVVEALYQVGSVSVKAAVIEALQPIYTSLRKELDSGSEAESLQRHVARKVMTQCCVEQYVHRYDDWHKLAQRQVQVQRLLWRMSLD